MVSIVSGICLNIAFLSLTHCIFFSLLSLSLSPLSLSLSLSLSYTQSLGFEHMVTLQRLEEMGYLKENTPEVSTALTKNIFKCETSFLWKRLWQEQLFRVLLLLVYRFFCLGLLLVRAMPRGRRSQPRRGSPVSTPHVDLNTLTVYELRARCHDAGLPETGRKAALVARLSNANQPPRGTVNQETSFSTRSQTHLSGSAERNLVSLTLFTSWTTS